MERQQFLQQLADRFPEVIPQISEYSQGLLHCEIGDFLTVVESAMDRGSLWRVEQYLRFLDDCRQAASPELANAIDVSFLEDFALGEFTVARHRAVRERMPPNLREHVVSINARWR